MDMIVQCISVSMGLWTIKTNKIGKIMDLYQYFVRIVDTSYYIAANCITTSSSTIYSIRDDNLRDTRPTSSFASYESFLSLNSLTSCDLLLSLLLFSANFWVIRVYRYAIQVFCERWILCCGDSYATYCSHPGHSACSHVIMNRVST